MGYNRALEKRIDRLTAGLSLDKKKMFGGIGYLTGGNMCFGIHKQSLVLRVSPGKADELMKTKQAVPFDITGRPMKGWVLVLPEVVDTDARLGKMLALGFNFAATLAKR